MTTTSLLAFGFVVLPTTAHAETDVPPPAPTLHDRCGTSQDEVYIPPVENASYFREVLNADKALAEDSYHSAGGASNVKIISEYQVVGDDGWGYNKYVTFEYTFDSAAPNGCPEAQNIWSIVVGACNPATGRTEITLRYANTADASGFFHDDVYLFSAGSLGTYTTYPVSSRGRVSDGQTVTWIGGYDDTYPVYPGHYEAFFISVAPPHRRLIDNVKYIIPSCGKYVLENSDAGSGGSSSTSALSVSRVDEWRDPCQDVLFVGARGSGETTSATHMRMGARVNTVFQGMLSTMSQRRVGYWSVIYPAHEVDALLHGSPATKKAYFNGLSDGVANVRAVLSRRADRCTDEKYVLAGYSQGAMAVHRALWDIENRRRIIGVVLVADGDRRPGDGAQSLGTTRTSEGITWRLPEGLGSRREARNAPLPGYFRQTGRVISICDEHDVVCDFTATRLIRGKRVHEQHYLGRGSTSADAGRSMGRRVMQET